MDNFFTEIRISLTTTSFSTLPPLLSPNQKETPAQPPVLATKSIDKLNSHHKRVFNKRINALLSGVSATSLDGKLNIKLSSTQRLSFLYAPGETEKPSLTTKIQRFLKYRGMLVLGKASSAVAAQLLDGRHTGLLAFKISMPVHYQIMCNVDVNSSIFEKPKKNLSYYLE